MVAPQTSAKNAVSPGDVAGSQNAKHARPHNRVKTPAVSSRLYLSLSLPIIGLPIAVPTFRRPIMSVAWVLVSPMDKAKSDREKRSTI